MTTDTISSGATRLLAAAALGTVWNAYGLVKFIGSFAQTHASLVAAGMTTTQAEIYNALPRWISAFFAIGVIGGLFGSIALGLKSAVARPIFAVSLVGYTFLFGGDAYYGVFGLLPVLWTRS